MVPMSHKDARLPTLVNCSIGAILALNLLYFPPWIGLVPKQNSSGGKERLGNISKRGDRYLRGLFTAGALAVIRYAKIHGTRHRPWLTAIVGAASHWPRG